MSKSQSSLMTVSDECPGLLPGQSVLWCGLPPFLIYICICTYIYIYTHTHIYKSLTFLFYFWPCHTAAGSLVLQPGIRPVPTALEARHPNHWTTREIPYLHI